ncbi:hypothetical protein HGI15_21560, partial [Modestobacter lapidis]|nr:hypothetical protein [Modestobacter lapidis]
FSILLSMFIGSLGGLAQIKIKILLAYSGVINVSYLLLALLVNNLDGLVAFIIYIVQYSFTHFNLFASILLMSYYLFNFDSKEKYNNIIYGFNSYSPVEFIQQFVGLLNKNSYLAMAILISLFSLIGIPPLVGFFGKLYILIASLKSGFVLLSVGLIIFSLITTVYYAYVIKVISFDNSFKFNNLQLNYENNNQFSSCITYFISVITLFTILNFLHIDVLVQGAYILACNIFTL